MRRALDEVEVTGVQTTLPFDRALVRDPAFADETGATCPPTGSPSTGTASRIEPARSRSRRSPPLAPRALKDPRRHRLCAKTDPPAQPGARTVAGPRSTGGRGDTCPDHAGARPPPSRGRGRGPSIRRRPSRRADRVHVAGSSPADRRRAPDRRGRRRRLALRARRRGRGAGRAAGAGDRATGSRRRGWWAPSRSVPSSRAGSSSVAVAAGDRRRGRSDAPGRGGDEDAERAARAAGRDGPRVAVGRRLDRRGRRRPGGHRVGTVSDAPDRRGRPVGEGTDAAPRSLAGDRCGPRPRAAAPERRDPFETSSGIEIRDLYTPADIAGLDEARDLGRPGEYPFTRGVQPTMYRSRFWTMRQYAGLRHRRGDQPALPLPARPGPDRPVGRLRPADPDGLRLGRPGGRGRGRPGRRPDLAAWPTWRSCSTASRSGEVTTSMTINATAPILLALYVAAAEAQGVERARISGTTQNDILKEYIARGHLHLPAPPVDAPRDRRLRVLRRASCRSGTRSRSAATTCARPGRRPPRSWPSPWPTPSPTSRRPSSAGSTSTTSPAACRSSSPPGRELFEEVAKFRAARRMWATIMRERFGATEPALDAVPLPRPDRGLVADRPVDRQQRRPDHDPGARGGPRRGPEPAHELPGRGARPADRGGGPAGPADPADPGLRGRRDRDARPAGRLVLRREPDERARGGRVGLPRRDRGPGRDARGHRAGLPAARDPGGGLPRPAGDRRGRPGRRRRQPLPRRRGRHAARSTGSTRRGSAARSSGSDGSGPSARPRRGRRRWTSSSGSPAPTATSCRRSSRRSAPTRRSARSATACGSPGASTASSSPSDRRSTTEGQAPVGTPPTCRILAPDLHALARWSNGRSSIAAASISSSGASSDSTTVRCGMTSSNTPPYGGHAGQRATTAGQGRKGSAGSGSSQTTPSSRRTTGR